MSGLHDLRPGIIRRLRLYLDRGYTDPEIVDEFTRSRRATGGLALRDQRLILAALAELRGEPTEMIEDETPLPADSPRRGPIVTRTEVEAVRDRLMASGLPHGYRSIAKEGLWSVATVRRRLNGN